MTDQPFDCQRCRDGCPCLPGSAGCAHFGCEGNAPDDVFMSCAGVAVIQGELAEHGTQLPRTRAGARAASVLAAVGLIATAAGVAGCGQLHASIDSSGATVSVGTSTSGSSFGIQPGPVLQIGGPARPGADVAMRPVTVHVVGPDNMTVHLVAKRAEHLHHAHRIPVAWQHMVSAAVTIQHGNEGHLIMTVRIPTTAKPGLYKGLVEACQGAGGGASGSGAGSGSAHRQRRVDAGASLGACQATDVYVRVGR